jgi:hypothetical protein
LSASGIDFRSPLTMPSAVAVSDTDEGPVQAYE